MTRRWMMGLLAAALVCTSIAPATAHENFRIIGTIETVTAKTLDVKQTKDGKTVSMAMVEKSIVTRSKKKVPASELKTGLHVVVDAFGDDIEELDVVEVRIVPAPAK